MKQQKITNYNNEILCITKMAIPGPDFQNTVMSCPCKVQMSNNVYV